VPKHVLVPIDESPRASAALAELSLVCDRRDQVVLMSVARPIPRSEGGKSRLEQLADLQAFLDEKADELRQRGFHVRTEAALDARPARAIIEYARRAQPSLIAMIRRSHDPRRFIFGSVSGEVVKSDVAPVVLLPPSSGR
jgi:nucleotide-binding universal stress UspA family protein